MKTTLFFLIFAIATPGTRAAGGGASAGGAVSTTAPTMPAASGNANSSTTANQSGPATPNPYSLGISNRNPYFMGTNNQNPYFGASNRFAATNQLGANSNQFQGSNNLSPTGAASGTNQVNSNFVRRDHAATQNDESLIMNLREMIKTDLGIASVREELPVHLDVDNGVVTLLGFVPTASDNQRILLGVQQTPGVVQVIDRLHVGMPPGRIQPYRAPDYVGQTTDQAFSPADQKILQSVRQTAITQFGMNNSSTAPTAPTLPVNFSVQNGIVSVTGTFVSESQRQAVLAALRRTPGVMRVVDTTQIGGASAIGTSQTGTTTNQ